MDLAPGRLWPEGESVLFSILWTVRKMDVGQADCELWQHRSGYELRLMINNSLLQSYIFTDEDLAWVRLAREWKVDFTARGWTEPPPWEQVGEV